MLIEIGPSRLLRLILCAIWALGALLIVLQDLVWGGVGQLLWAMAIAYWGITTHGLNNARLSLQADRKELRLLNGGDPVPITAIRPGIISVALVSVELKTAQRRYAILVGPDNLGRDARRYLRRVLLR